MDILYFSADWCAPCKMQSPVIKEIKDSKLRGVKVYKIDIDEEQTKTQKYGVMSVPTIILEKKGKEVKRFVGFTSKTKILTELDS